MPEDTTTDRVVRASFVTALLGLAFVIGRLAAGAPLVSG